MPFNLTYEPWIPVVTPDFRVKEVSLIELYETWDMLREIQADNPPTTLAIYRLLLAIIHRAYQGPRDEDHWEEIFEDNGAKVIAYLNQWRDRFDLLHPQYPFMQDPTISLETASECHAYLAHEMQGANTPTVFCHEHHWGNSALSLPQAARLTLRLQAFDLYGRKTGVSERAGAIPMMNAANVLICGETLKGFILRNSIRYSPKDEYPSVVNGEDLPIWERTLEKPDNRIPAGIIDYLTYQWRRVRLFLDNELVVRVASHPGDILPKNISPEQWECGVAYKDTQKGRLPVQLNSQRSLWRDSSVFLQSADTSTCPRIIQWQAILRKADLIPSVVHFQILGLQADQASPIKHFSEGFSVSIDFLRDRELWQNLKLAITATEEHQVIFRYSQGNPYHELAKALSPPTTSNRVISEKARQLSETLAGESCYWAMLDMKFPKFIEALPRDYQTGADCITYYGKHTLPEWIRTVQDAAKTSFTQSIESIRNYEARARALQVLDWRLAALRTSPEEKAARKAKAAAKKKLKTTN